MGKSGEEAARREGMAYALRIAKEKGIDALEDDLRLRNAIGLPCRITQKQLDEFSLKVKENTMECVLALTMVTLHDEFDMGQKRLERFAERFWSKAECIDGDYATWRDNLDILKDECGIEFEIHGYNDNDMQIH